MNIHSGNPLILIYNVANGWIVQINKPQPSEAMAVAHVIQTKLARPTDETLASVKEQQSKEDITEKLDLDALKDGNTFIFTNPADLIGFLRIKLDVPQPVAS